MSIVRTMAPNPESDPEAFERSQFAEALIGSTMITLTANIIGSGIYSLPWALKQASCVTGILFMVTIGLLSSSTFVLLALCCERAGTFNYLEMARRALGDTFAVLLQICSICYAFGSCVAYAVLAADFLADPDTGVFGQWAPDSVLSGKSYSRAFAMSLCCSLLIPLALLRQLNLLKYTSITSVLFLLYCMSFILVTAARGYDQNVVDGVLTDEELNRQNSTTMTNMRDSVEVIGFPVGVTEALPLMNVAYCAHYNAPRLYQEFFKDDRSIPRFITAVAGANVLATLIYIMTAVSGYITFGDSTEGDILKNFNIEYQPAQVEVVLAYNGGIFGSCITYISPALIYSALHMKPVDPAETETKPLLCPGHQEIIATFGKKNA